MGAASRPFINERPYGPFSADTSFGTLQYEKSRLGSVGGHPHGLRTPD